MDTTKVVEAVSENSDRAARAVVGGMLGWFLGLVPDMMNGSGIMLGTFRAVGMAAGACIGWNQKKSAKPACCKENVVE